MTESPKVMELDNQFGSSSIVLCLSICNLSQFRPFPNSISTLLTMRLFFPVHAFHVVMACPSYLLQTIPPIWKPLQLTMPITASLRSAQLLLPALPYDLVSHSHSTITARRMATANTNWADLRVSNWLLYDICANTRSWRLANTRDLWIIWVTCHWLNVLCYLWLIACRHATKRPRIQDCEQIYKNVSDKRDISYLILIHEIAWSCTSTSISKGVVLWID